MLCVYEVCLRQIPNNYKYKNDLLDSTYEGIILGNSHAYRGFIAKNMSYPCINLANVSQSIDLDLKWFNEAIQHNDLRFVVLTVGFPTLFKTLNESEENWRIKDYNLYTNLRLDYKLSHNFEFLNNLQKDNLNNLWNYALYPNHFKVTCLKKGSYPLNLTMENFEEDAVKSVNRHFESGLKLFEKNQKILGSIVSTALQHNIEVFILTPPMHKTYRDLVKTEYSEKLFNTVNVLAKNKNVHYLNYYNDLSFTSNMYKDSNHVNTKGAVFLTKKLQDRLKTILDK